jgi:hypothetical protein
VIKLLGYMPDVDRTTPGALMECVSYVPSIRGMKAAPSPVTGTLSSALAAECRGASVLTKIDNSNRFFAGTATKLYEGGATSWSDVTRAAGGDYTLASSDRWCFAQFGNVSLACAKSDTMQFSNGSGAFANIAGGIKSAVMDTVGEFIVAGNTNEGTYGDCPNRWWVTPDYADWTPSIGNRIATGTIASSAGGIKAIKRFGESVVIYKESSMFLGRPVGPPLIFAATEISGEIGAPSQDAVAYIGTESEPRHIFMGYDDFYLFDGARPIKIGAPVRKTVFSDINRAFSYKCSTLHDRFNSLVYFYYPSVQAGALDRCVVYDYKSDRWGRDDRTVEAVMQYGAVAFTYDDLGSLLATYDTSAAYTYDSQFFVSNNKIPAIFNSSHVLQLLVGVGSNGSLTPADIGDEALMHTVSRATPRWQKKPTEATLTNFYRSQIDEPWEQDYTVSMSEGRFDFMREARWHKVQINTVGESEISDLRLNIIEGGEE